MGFRPLEGMAGILDPRLRLLACPSQQRPFLVELRQRICQSKGCLIAIIIVISNRAIQLEAGVRTIAIVSSDQPPQRSEHGEAFHEREVPGLLDWGEEPVRVSELGVT